MNSKLRFATVLAALLIGSVAMASDVGRCATAWVPHPIVLPDGSVHEPGALRLCLKSVDPISGYYEISINGAALGRWPSRIGESEGPASAHPVAVFKWTDEGNLQLVGFARPNGSRMATYAFHGYGKLSKQFIADASKMLSPEQADGYVTYIAQAGSPRRGR